MLFRCFCNQRLSIEILSSIVAVAVAADQSATVVAAADPLLLLLLSDRFGIRNMKIMTNRLIDHSTASAATAKRKE